MISTGVGKMSFKVVSVVKAIDALWHAVNKVYVIIGHKHPKSGDLLFQA